VTSGWIEALSWLTAASAVLLVAAYGIGAPFFLLRTLLALSKRRRLRYRTRNDDVLATSRFTIPVSLIVPIKADADDAPHRVRHLLQLRYPELELIVVVSAGRLATRTGGSSSSSRNRSTNSRPSLLDVLKVTVIASRRPRRSSSW